MVCIVHCLMCTVHSVMLAQYSFLIIKIVKSCQNSNPMTIQPTTLSSSLSSPSVPSNIQHFNKLAASAQTHPRRNSMSSQFSRIEEFMSKISQDFQEFKKDNTKTTQTLVGHATTLTTHGNSLASILKTQDKQQRKLNNLQNQNTTLIQDLAEQTDRITQNRVPT